MNLQTKIPLQPQKHNQIDYHSNLLLLGSCFAEHIGDKFNYFKFRNTVNPFGILFHPLGIETFLTHTINTKTYTENDIFFNDEQWHCFDVHSKLSNRSKEALLDHLNDTIKRSHQLIHNASHIVVTLGTAWVYRFIETDKIVANCHKVPQKQFLKELLSVEDIVSSLNAVISLVKRINPKVTFVITVSPVRHLKDGFIENTQSKSHLIAAIHQVVDKRQQLHYFPSYELMMDELRDYRFYNGDMIHPNNLAVDYIWEKFKRVWLSETIQSTMDEVDTIQKGLMHRPFNPYSNDYQKFLKQLEVKQQNIKDQYPFITF